MTIGEALLAFDPTQHEQILVASGQYEEVVELEEGMGLFGGYSPDFTERDIVGYPTLIVAPEGGATSPNALPGAVNAVGIQSERTVVAGFAIYAADVAQQAASGEAGRSSYAVYLRNCTDAMVVANNLIFGGRGGDGGHGQPGLPGAGGGAGERTDLPPRSARTPVVQDRVKLEAPAGRTLHVRRALRATEVVGQPVVPTAGVPVAIGAQRSGRDERHVHQFGQSTVRGLVQVRLSDRWRPQRTRRDCRGQRHGGRRRKRVWFGLWGHRQRFLACWCWERRYRGNRRQGRWWRRRRRLRHQPKFSELHRWRAFG